MVEIFKDNLPEMLDIRANWKQREDNNEYP